MKYPPIAKALKQLGHKTVVDGEVVVLNEQGLPDFDALQLYNGHNTPITYYIFDILWLDGFDLKELPLTERKKIAQDLIGEHEFLKISASFDDGIKLYEQALTLNLEGIVSKKKNSSYREASVETTG
jgi:bifunctional non-homologous end joining protein LigD